MRLCAASLVNDARVVHKGLTKISNDIIQNQQRSTWLGLLGKKYSFRIVSITILKFKLAGRSWIPK